MLKTLGTPVMSITIKTPEEIEKMRVAGRLGAEVLDHIQPFVKPGITTGEIDQICHDYMINVQHTVPAPLNYAPPGHQPYPRSVCTSSRDVPLTEGSRLIRICNRIALAFSAGFTRRLRRTPGLRNHLSSTR